MAGVLVVGPQAGLAPDASLSQPRIGHEHPMHAPLRTRTEGRSQKGAEQHPSRAVIGAIGCFVLKIRNPSLFRRIEVPCAAIVIGDGIFSSPAHAPVGDEPTM